MTQTRPAVDPGATPIVFEAIVKMQCLAATYNGGSVTLAPHVVFMKHGDLFIDAITLDRDGKPPKEVKLGTFKLAGLGAIRLTPRAFKPSPLFVAKDLKYAEALLAVDAG